MKIKITKIRTNKYCLAAALVIVILAASGLAFKGGQYRSQKTVPEAGAINLNLIALSNKTKLYTAISAQQSLTTIKSGVCSARYAATIIVSLSQQHLWACLNQTTVYDTPVTTGATAYGDGTPTGVWSIYSKQTGTYLRGSDDRGSWDDFVNYWMPFYGAYGFHDASWQTFDFGDLTQYTTGGSHGCVHLPLAAMKWLFNWSDVGTTVTVQA